MKYWKQFWGGLNQGYKRMHYVLLPVLGYLIGSIISSPKQGWALVPFGIIGYVLVVSIIYWIKEGFQSKDEPTKEDE
jgi:hypothetical protein